MADCSGICTEEQFFFRGITITGVVKTDQTAPDIREDLKMRTLTGSTEWTQRVTKLTDYKPPDYKKPDGTTGSPPKKTWRQWIDTKNCTPAISCECDWMLEEAKSSEERFKMKIKVNNKEYEFSFSAKCIVNRKLGFCKSTSAREISYIPEGPLTTLAAMSVKDVISYAKGYITNNSPEDRAPLQSEFSDEEDDFDNDLA